MTNSDEIAQTCRRLKNHGRDRRGTFVHEHIGFNFSMTEMQAAIGVSQLRKLPVKLFKCKQEIYDTHAAGLKDIPQLQNYPFRTLVASPYIGLPHFILTIGLS